MTGPGEKYRGKSTDGTEIGGEKRQEGERRQKTAVKEGIKREPRGTRRRMWETP